MTHLALASSTCPVDTASLDQLVVSAEDLDAVQVALDWARDFLSAPHEGLGRKGPVCPYIRHSFDERLLFVTCRPEGSCNDPELADSVRAARHWFGHLQSRAPVGSEHLVTIVVVLPRIDRSASIELDALHRSLKDEFVAEGLMIGQFHPECQARGLWSADFRPLQAPVPLLAIREMVPSDLPFLVGSVQHANVYFERYALGHPGSHSSLPGRSSGPSGEGQAVTGDPPPTGSYSEPTTGVLAALASVDAHWAVVRHAELAEPIRSAADVARQLSLDVGAITKTLLVTRRPGPEAYALAVLPVEARMDLPALAAVLGWERVVLASPEELAEQVAQPVNGVSPLGSTLAVVVEGSLLFRPRILVGAGLPGFEIEIDPRVLVDVTGARFAPIIEGGLPAGAGSGPVGP